jgi:hypothetical protein
MSERTFKVEAEFTGGFKEAAEVEVALTELGQKVKTFQVHRISETTKRKAPTKKAAKPQAAA